LAYRLGESTCYEIITSTCEVIYNKLQPVYLALPSEEDWIKISKEFWNEWQMPNCIGAIDGKHIQIQCPPNSGSIYFNYKKTYSLVLLAVCNSKYEFTLFDIGAVGSESDGGILARSELGKALRENRLSIPQENRTLLGSNYTTPCYFVGDEAFQLSSNMMRPYSGRNLEDSKSIFNYRLSRARRIIENTFGILVHRWQFLKKSVGFHPDATIKCVLAAICLHNYIMKNKNSRSAYCEQSLSNHNNEPDENNRSQNLNGRNAVNDISFIDFQMGVQNGSCVRNTLRNYFITPEGEVPWQYDSIKGRSFMNENS